jgi:hypothetical protein
MAVIQRVPSVTGSAPCMTQPCCTTAHPLHNKFSKIISIIQSDNAVKWPPGVTDRVQQHVALPARRQPARRVQPRGAPVRVRLRALGLRALRLRLCRPLLLPRALRLPLGRERCAGGDVGGGEEVAAAALEVRGVREQQVRRADLRPPSRPVPALTIMQSCMPLRPAL